jgi:VanZ family protein
MYYSKYARFRSLRILILEDRPADAELILFAHQGDAKMQDLNFIPKWLLFIAYAIVLSWLSLAPEPPDIEGAFLGWDKLQHAAAYGVFTLLAGCAFDIYFIDLKRRWRMAAAAAVTYGGFLEIAQGVFTTTRTAAWSDLLADLVGAASAYGLIMIINRALSNRR